MENQVEKQEKSLPPGVAVDGTKIRAIREEKKLTQLYVANVVGVTTDTISRWENNRYPNMKRENAEKLAAALEVDLITIVKGEEPAAPIAEPAATAKGNRGVRLALILTGIALLIAAMVFLFLYSTPHSTVLRILPRFGAPGEIIPVRIKVTRKGVERAGLIIRESLPDGWHIVNLSPPATSVKSSSQEVKWLIPAGNSELTIYYTARVDPNAPLNANAEFIGSFVSSTDGSSHTESIGGSRLLRIAPVHWADANGDGRIDDDEIMPAYYLTEEMKGLGLEWKTIEAIWNAGGYHWERNKEEFVVGR